MERSGCSGVNVWMEIFGFAGVNLRLFGCKGPGVRVSKSGCVCVPDKSASVVIPA